MQYRLFSDDGKVRMVDAEWVAAAEIIAISSPVSTVDDIDPQAGLSTKQGMVEELSLTRTAMIEFTSVGDGRGFSLAAELREDNDFMRPLYACGKLIPDQLTLAFQCGFNGVVLDRDNWELYGESAWLRALTPTVSKGYMQGKWSAIDSIWQRRQVGVPRQ